MFTRNKMARITRIRPKPAYSLFPIVIAKCLHSPQQRSLLRTASVQNLLPALLVSTKFEFHNLRGFFRGRQETTQVVEFEFRDRKSTRLNSSHGYISYAVFCLKNK